MDNHIDMVDALTFVESIQDEMVYQETFVKITFVFVPGGRY